MVRILMHGCCGKMGRMITDLVKNEDGVEIVAGVDAFGEKYSDYPVYKSLDEFSSASQVIANNGSKAEEGGIVDRSVDTKVSVADVDVVVDFSNAKAADGLLDWCAANNKSVAVCTTGLSKKQLEHLKKTSERVAVLRSANMSVGINLILNLLKEAAPKLAEAGFDCEIVEKHHNQKVDAPSGTAIALADAVNDSIAEETGKEKYEYVYDRTQRREKRPKNEIGISSVRGGTIVGDHDVIFAGQDEVITFSHVAYSRAIFAKGAITAAKFLAGKPAGLYDMQDALA